MIMKVARKKAAKVSTEVPFYDWVPGCRWNELIYQGRKVSRVDPGIRRMKRIGADDVLYQLYKKEKLIGQALEDAKSIYGNLVF